MAVNVKCPYCGGRTATRTSSQPTPTTVEAVVYCTTCNNMKGRFVGELTEIKRANWQEDPEAKKGIFPESKPQSEPPSKVDLFCNDLSE
ncbi:hypothetical protein KRX11_01020 [Pasteurellaceae bacterium TAE3-ERU1]|nr:hypothetical protein [Pasteurellaceae bacterium TAE3-ERU1]